MVGGGCAGGIRRRSWGKTGLALTDEGDLSFEWDARDSPEKKAGKDLTRTTLEGKTGGSFLYSGERVVLRIDLERKERMEEKAEGRGGGVTGKSCYR